MLRSMLLTVLLAAPASAQGNFRVAEADIPRLKLNHYFTADKKAHEADFEWTFTKTGFTVKKGRGAIPTPLLDTLLPDGTTVDEVTGNWKFADGQLVLSDIKAGKVNGRKDVKLGVFKTAPTVVRVNCPHQAVFAVEK
ncbi:MAG: hypothetical protein ABGY75_13805 [Gemmataceae bacterium]